MWKSSFLKFNSPDLCHCASHNAMLADILDELCYFKVENISGQSLADCPGSRASWILGHLEFAVAVRKRSAS